jgi:hypothetical protein
MWMMMRRVALFLSFLLLGSALASSAQIRVNEILADPGIDWNGDGTVNSKGDEWVEIINAGSTPLDITNYRLGDESGGYAWRFAFSGTLSPGEILLVFGSDAVAWQTESSYPAYGLSLNNSGDTVYLYKVTESDTLLEDSYAYAAFAVQDDRSVGRNPNSPEDWVIFDGLNPYGGETAPFGTGCNPSPGFPNSCVTPMQRTSWGVLKSRYSN